MKRQFTNLLLSLALFAAGSLNAQVFFSENFASGIPATWTNTDTSGQGVTWEHCKHPDSACVNLYNLGKPATSTANNGMAMVNSDAFFTLVGGQPASLPKYHGSRLTTAPISCTGKPKVFLKFQSYIAEFNDDAKAQVRVSNDSINWTIYNIGSPYVTIPFGAGSTVSDNPLASIIDISSKAGNKPKVWIQWEWSANWDYWWFLDDIQLTTQNPIDVAVTEFFYPLSSFKTPEFAIARDSFGFSCRVANHGGEDLAPFKIRCQVIDLSNGNAVLYRDSILTDGLAVGQVGIDLLDSLFVFDGLYAPELPQGLYQVKYTAFSSIGTDAKPNDNTKSFNFEVSDFQFAVDHNQVTNGYRPGGAGGDWATGAMYSMLGLGGTENYVAENITIRATTNPGELAIEDAVAELWLFKVKDDVVAMGFDNFDPASFDQSPSLEWLGLAGYEFEATDDNKNIDVQILHWDTGLPIPIVNDGRYFVACKWANDSKVVFHIFDEAVPYSNGSINTLVYTDQWYLGGFAAAAPAFKPSAFVRLSLALGSSIDDTPLPESAVSAFPNPTTDLLNLELSFDQPTDLTVTLAEMTGKVLNIRHGEKITAETMVFDLSKYPAGTYLARVATKEGTKTTTFIKL